MKNCDNCMSGSYGLDCNTGIETLYCRESKYEHEVKSTDVCDMHQFIDEYVESKVMSNSVDTNNIGMNLGCSLNPESAYVKKLSKNKCS